MIVEIRTSDDVLKAGDRYKASPYWLDPSQKVTLHRKIGKHGREIGKEVHMNAYINGITVVEQ